MILPPCPVCGRVNTWDSCYHIDNNCVIEDHIGDKPCVKCGDPPYLFRFHFKEEEQ